jgi:hypothetical protein
MLTKAFVRTRHRSPPICEERRIGDRTRHACATPHFEDELPPYRPLLHGNKGVVRKRETNRAVPARRFSAMHFLVLSHRRCLSFFFSTPRLRLWVPVRSRWRAVAWLPTCAGVDVANGCRAPSHPVRLVTVAPRRGPHPSSRSCRFCCCRLVQVQPRELPSESSPSRGAESYGAPSIDDGGNSHRRRAPV